MKGACFLLLAAAALAEDLDKVRADVKACERDHVQCTVTITEVHPGWWIQDGKPMLPETKTTVVKTQRPAPTPRPVVVAVPVYRTISPRMTVLD